MNQVTQILTLFRRWNEALQSGDSDKVVRLYAADAVLLPTVSDRVRHNHPEIRDYFTHFLKKSPKGTINEHNIRVFGDIAVNSGIYTFSLLADSGHRARVRARFTFVYRRIRGKWMIIEHHSSRMPED